MNERVTVPQRQSKASKFQENLVNLKAVPSELGEKFQRPFKEAGQAADGLPMP